MGEGLSWWNEEFWVTVAINFTSVAVTIVLTVIISLWIFRKQAKHEQLLQARQRKEQKRDLILQIKRETRLRSTEGFHGVLTPFYLKIRNHAAEYRPFQSPSTQVSAGPLLDTLPNLLVYVARIESNKLSTLIADFAIAVEDWFETGRLSSQFYISEEWLKDWYACGDSLAKHVAFIKFVVEDWEYSGMDMRSLESTEHIIAKLAELRLQAQAEVRLDPPPQPMFEWVTTLYTSSVTGALRKERNSLSQPEA